MRGKKSALTSSPTAGPANLPLKICAPPERLREGPCCSDHGCTGRACGFEVPRPIRRHAGFSIGRNRHKESDDIVSQYATTDCGWKAEREREKAQAVRRIQPTQRAI